MYEPKDANELLKEILDKFDIALKDNENNQQHTLYKQLFEGEINNLT